MSLFRRLTFNLWYLNTPPWERDFSPPELTNYIQQNQPGRAIDLGCGTGTHAITLAKAGWQVTGVDFAHLAIWMARRKARGQGVKVRLLPRDVTHLNGIKGPFDLALDMGCLHAVEDKPAYLRALKRVLAPGGHWLFYAFFRPEEQTEGPGLTSSDMRLLEEGLQQVWRQDGRDSRGRASAWFLYQKT